MSSGKNEKSKLTKGGGVDLNGLQRSHTALDWFITNVEGTNKDDLKSFFKSYIYKSLFVLVIAFITYIIYLIVIIAHKGQELSLWAWGVVQFGASVTFFFYLLLGLWTAFRLAYSDSDLYNNIGAGSIHSFMCHTKAVFEYSSLTLVIFFWKTLLLSEILGRVIKISSRLVEPNSDIWNIVKYPAILFIIMLIVCLLLLVIFRIKPTMFKPIVRAMNTSRSAISTVYLFSLTGIVTFALLAGPIFAYVFINNTEDVTVNCNPNEQDLTGNTAENAANKINKEGGSTSGGGTSGSTSGSGDGGGSGGGEGGGGDSGTTSGITSDGGSGGTSGSGTQPNGDSNIQQASNNSLIKEQVVEEQCQSNKIRADYSAAPVVIGFMCGTAFYAIILIWILKMKIDGENNPVNPGPFNRIKIIIVNVVVGSLIKAIKEIEVKTKNHKMQQLENILE